MTKKNTNSNTNPMLSVQKAAAFLDVNPGTIRRWARDKQIKGLKVGTRGDWRFTKKELESALKHDTQQKNIAKVKKVISSNAFAIQKIATKEHKKYLDTPKLRNEFIQKYVTTHIEAVKAFVTNLEDIDKGVPVFKTLGEKLAKDALHDGLILEEAVDGTIFLKQAVWSKLQDENILDVLTTEDFYRISQMIGTYSDVLATTVAFTYHDYYKEEQKKAVAKLEEQATLLQVANDAFIVQDTKNKIISWNKGAEKMYGYTEEEVVGKTAQKILKTVFSTPFSDIHQAIKKQGFWQGELRHRNKQGDEIIVDSRWVIIREGPSPLHLEVNRDITDRIKAEKQKDEFVAVVSHELKTPVTSLKAYAQVLQLRFMKAGEHQAAHMLSKMDAQINKLTNLIGDLLDVTRIEGGRLQFHNDYFSFDELVGELVEELQRTTEKHKIVMKGKTEKTIYGDKERIGQVITNYLSNAIKYSLHSDRIIVTLSATKDDVTCSVTDFGVGIPEDKLAHVFEQFYRVPGKTHDTVPGMGIGLYIAKEIIIRQGGTVWAESTPGNGSTFNFTLPINGKSYIKQK